MTAVGPGLPSLQERVNAFGYWHYAIDLPGGVQTPIANPDNINRHQQRRHLILPPLLAACGGTLAGRRVLDLGCNAGFWSLAAARAGAEHVLGIDGRPEHVEQARLVLEACGFGQGGGPGEVEFRTADVLSLDPAGLGRVDVVLCLGLLYHVRDPLGLFATITALQAPVLLVDTVVCGLAGAAFTLAVEDPADPRNALADPRVLVPSRGAVRELAERAGYQVEELIPQFSDYTGAADYEQGDRAAFLGQLRSGDGHR